MLILKKVFSRFFFPIPLCLEVLFIGLLLLWFTRKQRSGKMVVALAGVLLFLFSNHSVSNMLLAPLENRYPPLYIAAGAPSPAAVQGAKFIVVLSSGFSYDARRPAAIQLDDSSAARLVEAVRVSKLLNCCKLIVSGGPGPVNLGSSPAQAMAELAEELGVSRQEIIIESHSNDTEDQARLISPLTGQQPFILVTEASHMPRAMAMFRKLGAHPIADPMGFRVTADEPTAPGDLFPDAERLRVSQRAVYEYLGLAWGKLRGKL